MEPSTYIVGGDYAISTLFDLTIVDLWGPGNEERLHINFLPPVKHIPTLPKLSQLCIYRIFRLEIRLCDCHSSTNSSQQRPVKANCQRVWSSRMKNLRSQGKSTQ